jgi:DNA-binding transcriptional regulator GbsR (MarR family)
MPGTGTPRVKLTLIRTIAAIDGRPLSSDISVVTEINEAAPSSLSPTVREFVLRWGEMGDRWGMTRSVAQVHALLYLAERPLTAEDVAGQLAMARSNVSTSLKELLAWQLVHRVPQLGERRDFYAAETDLWTVLARIAAGRKARELDPAAAALRGCLLGADRDPALGAVPHARLAAMLAFVDEVGRWYDDMLRLPPAQAQRLLRLGAGVARFLPGGRDPGA